MLELTASNAGELISAFQEIRDLELALWDPVSPGVVEARITLAEDTVFTFDSRIGEFDPHALRPLPYYTRVEIVGKNTVIERAEGAPEFRFIRTNGLSLTAKGITFRNGKTFGGGAIYTTNSQANITLIDCIFENNSGNTGDGGAIYCVGVLSAINCQFINNESGDDGGAIISFGSNNYLKDCLFQLNEASGYGGAVELYHNIFIENCRFLENTCSYIGGAALLYGGYVNIIGCLFEDNQTTSVEVNTVGAVEISGDLTNIVGSIFRNNQTNGTGGALRLESKEANVRNSLFENNQASGSGSAIYGYYGFSTPQVLTVNQNSFIGNTNPTDAADPVIDAQDGSDFRHNYWGTADGPSGAGPGSGQPIPDNILYQPFLGTPAPVEHDGEDSCFSAGNDSLTAGNPISLRTGEKREHATDLTLQTKMGALTFSRSYRQSTQTARDFMGRGWSHNHHMRLSEDTGLKKITVDRPDGTTVFYDDNGDDIFEGAAGATARIVKDTNGYTLSLPDESQYVFNTAGEIISHTMRDGQTWYYHYSNQLALVHDDPTFNGTDESNIQWALRFAYYNTSDFRDGKLWRVGLLESTNLSTTPDGPYVEFDYTELSGVGVFLTRVRDVLDYSQCYRYGFQEGETDTLLQTYLYRHLAILTAGITDCSSTDVIEVSNTSYTLDVNDAITQIVQTRGDALISEQFEFGADSTTQQITGYPSYGSTHNYSNGVYTGSSDPDGNTQEEVLTSQYNKAIQTDRNGNSSLMQWSADGERLEGVTDALGNTMKMLYDPQGRIFCSQDPGGRATLAAYDGTAREPSAQFVTDGSNLIANGLMATDTDWTAVGTPTTSEQRPPSGIPFGRYVEADAASEGIESLAWDVVANNTYTLRARVYVLSGTVKLHVPGVSGLAVSSTGTGWQTLDVEDTPTSGISDVHAQLIADGAAASFYVSYVTLMEDDGSTVSPLPLQGNLMLDAYWTDISGSEPLVNQSIDEQRYVGKASWYVEADAVDEGIESTSFDLTSGETYQIFAYVRPLTGTAVMQLQGVSSTLTSVSSGNGTDAWERLEITHTATATETATLRFLSGNSAAATFFVDAVYVLDKNSILRQSKKTYNSRRQVINKQQIDPADGVTILRETDYCYDDDTCYSGGGTARGLLWRTTIKEQGGLNDILITNTYDDFGRVIQHQQSSQFGDCDISRTVYDDKGQVVASICNYDPGSSAAPTTAAEAAALYASTGDPDKNQVTTYVYDALGRRVTMTTDAGTPFARVTRFVHDSLGRVTRRIENYVPETASMVAYTAPDSWSWDGSQWVDGATTPVSIEHGTDLDENIITDTAYNTFGQVRLQRDVLGHAVLYGYNTLGQMVKTIVNPVDDSYNNDYDGTNPDPSLTNYVVDTTVTDADLVATMRYDAVGNEIERVDTLGRTIYTVYDALNRPVKVVASAKDSATIALNPGDTGYLASNDPRSVGYTLSAEPDRDRVMITDYDSLGRVIRRQQVLENRDTGVEWDTTLYGYNTLGQQVRTIQHASQPDYLTQNPEDPTLVNYVPEADATDVDLIVESSYDPQGRVVYSTDVDDNEMWRGYDGFNRLVQQVTNASSTGVLAPDDPAYVGDLNDPASDLISKTDFNASGRVVKQRRVLRTNDAGTALEWVYTLYGYDNRGRVVKTIQNASDPGYVDSNPSDEDLSGYTVSGNADEDRISSTVYDAQGRVKATTDTRGNTTLYGYDSANRRVTTIVNASDASYDYEVNSDTRLDAYTGSSPEADQDRISRMSYDLAGRMISSTDVAGRVAYRVYDAMGRSTLRVTNYDNPDNLGNPTYTDPDTWSWDGTQWIDGASTPVVISHGTDADQNLISEMVYNKGGEMLTTRDVHGTVTAFAYDDMGRRVQVTQAQGTPLETTSYTCFDKSGRVRRQVMNVNTTADLDARAGGEWEVVPTGHGGDNDTDVVTETIYDRASRPVQRINPVGDVVKTAYFKNGQVATVTHKDVLVKGAVQDVVMLYRYDALYRRTLVVQNYVDQGGVDPANWVFESGVWKTGPSGTAIVHDPTSSGNASQNIIVQASYDKSGRTVSLRDPNGNVTDYEYDQLGRRTKLSNPLGYEWLTAYEDVGETSRVTMTYPGIEEISSVWQSYDVQQDFDRLGRLTEVIYPDADVTPDVTFSYDVSGNRTAMLETDAASATVRETQYSYDAMNRLVQMQLDRDGDGNVDEAVQYSYDERGLRTQLVIDPSGDNLQVTYVYDEKQRLVALTNWDAQTTSYDYDRMNRHTDTLHPNGVQSRYDYDPAGRLQHLRHRDGRDTLAAFKYEVDARGNRVKTWEMLAGETRTLVAGDTEVTERGTWVTNGALHETTQWDAALTLTVWGHEDVKLTIGTGPENSIFDIYIDGTLYISPDGYAATPGEREISLDIRDKQIRQHVIQLRNRHEKNLASNGHKLQFKQLTLGKVQQIDYDYDALSRVLRADYADNSRSYAYLYDLAGNRLQEAVTIGITTTVTDWTYDAANRVNTMQVGSNPVDTFGYDANGNLLSAGGHSYEWNHAGRMTQLDTGAGIYHYAYDGDDNRLSQRLGTTTTEYLLDMQPGLAEVLREMDGTTTSHYVHGPRGVQAVEQTNTWTLLLQDGLGSVRAQVDSTADVDATQHHSPYGQPFDQVGTWTGSFGYAGEQIDPTGLSYNRARYYDPNMGMFTALDPFEGMMSEPMSMNGYSYVHGNPVNMIDPSGEIPQALIGTVVGGILGGITGVVLGGWQAGLTYDFALAGECGCERKTWAQSNSRQDVVRQAQLVAGGIGTAMGAAFGTVGAATAGAGWQLAVASAVQIFGLALELYGIAETSYYGTLILRDYAEDRRIDNRCNVVNFLFGAIDILAGRAFEFSGNYIQNNTRNTTSDPTPRNPDIVENIETPNNTSGSDTFPENVAFAESTQFWSPFIEPRIYRDRHRRLTTGTYTLELSAQNAHTNGLNRDGQSTSHFLFGHMDIDIHELTLRAAHYADQYGLWTDRTPSGGPNSKAKVYVVNGPIGIDGRSGEFTSWINVYRIMKRGIVFVHSAPTSTPGDYQ